MHPILFQIGPFTFHSYGLMAAVGFVVAVSLAARRAREVGVSTEKIQQLAFLVFLGGIVGGRIAFVGLNWTDYAGNPIEIIRLDHGGLVFYGGFLGGAAAALFAIRKFSLKFWETLDLLTPPLILAHAVGRIGCFLNGCCYGKPTSLPWAVAFPFDGVPRHPTQLYEAAVLFILFFAFKKLERSPHQPGALFLLYGVCYGIWRFSVEFLRGDSPAVWAGLTIFQVLSAALIALFALLLYARRRPG